MVPVPPNPGVAALASGDKIAVIAPSSAPLETADLVAGLRRLEAKGFQIVTAYGMSEPPGYLADPDHLRLAFLNDTLARDDVRAVFCVRGGYGSLRILDRLDFDAIRRAPKIIVGYSDITAIHLGVLAHTGLPGLSAAMVATDWKDIDRSEADTIFDILAGTADTGLYDAEGLAIEPDRPGTAVGRAIGGNLTLLCRLLGTPYFPDPSGAILFIEEIGEQPYRVDGLFAQLRLSGVLERISGLVIGGITDAEPAPGRPSLDLRDVLRHYMQFVDGPVASKLPYGHFQPKVPMPVGVRVRLEADDQHARLTALEPLVRTL
jgi:muramoyltetrapeptide carboxypeptidase